MGRSGKVWWIEHGEGDSVDDGSSSSSNTSHANDGQCQSSTGFCVKVSDFVLDDKDVFTEFLAQGLRKFAVLCGGAAGSEGEGATHSAVISKSKDR